MSETKGGLLVYLRLPGKPSTRDLAVIGEVFGKTAASLGIAHSGYKVDSVGKTARIQAGDVTGFTDADSPVEASWTPGILSIEIRQHPGGFEGARAEAERMAQRLVGATGCQLGQPGRIKAKRNMACSAAWPVSGLVLPVPTITADFTPAR